VARQPYLRAHERALLIGHPRRGQAAVEAAAGIDRQRIGKRWTQLLLLAGLRRLRPPVLQVITPMPIIMNIHINPFLQRLYELPETVSGGPAGE
jgi:hypothetical protein